MMKTIFSSNLVQAVGTTNVNESIHLVLSPDFWKFPLLTVGLIIITLVPAFGWRKFWPVFRQRIVNRV